MAQNQKRKTQQKLIQTKMPGMRASIAKKQMVFL